MEPKLRQELKIDGELICDGNNAYKSLVEDALKE